jgi:hypothetical protein
MLDETLYADALRKLLHLFGYNADLRMLYAAKLVADAGNELEGTFTRDTRDILARIAQRWQRSDATPEDVVRAALGGSLPATDTLPPGWILHNL